MGKTRGRRRTKARAKATRTRTRRVQRGGGVEFNTSMDHIVSDINKSRVSNNEYVTVINGAFDKLIALINTIQPGVLNVPVAVPPTRATTAAQLYTEFHTLNETLKEACNAKKGIFTSTPADKINAARKAINQDLHSTITAIHQRAKPQESSTTHGISPSNLMRLGSGF